MSLELLVETDERAARPIVREIRKRARTVYDANGAQIYSLLKEFEKAKADPAQIELRDAEQLLEMARSLAEKIDANKEGIAKKHNQRRPS